MSDFFLLNNNISKKIGKINVNMNEERLKNVNASILRGIKENDLYEGQLCELFDILAFAKEIYPVLNISDELFSLLESIYETENVWDNQRELDFLMGGVWGALSVFQSMLDKEKKNGNF